MREARPREHSLPIVAVVDRQRRDGPDPTRARPRQPHAVVEAAGDHGLDLLDRAHGGGGEYSAIAGAAAGTTPATAMRWRGSLSATSPRILWHPGGNGMVEGDHRRTLLASYENAAAIVSAIDPGQLLCVRSRWELSHLPGVASMALQGQFPPPTPSLALRAPRPHAHLPRNRRTR
jgi:hypothetical protein